MMGFAHNNNSPKIKSEQQLSPAVVKKPDDHPFIEFEDYSDSFLDSLLNFDGWVEDYPNSLVVETMNSEQKLDIEIKKEVEEVEEVEEVKEVCGSEKLEDLGCLIQEGMGKVRLTSGVDVIEGLENSEVIGGENGAKNENEVKNESEIVVDDVKEESEDSDSDSEEEDSSSSSSSSSSDDDDEDEDDDEEEEEDDDEKGKKGEMEEGEIREEMVSWSEDEDDGGVKGPIRSKNEVQNLPPVPPVNVTIQPHHQTLPVGVILSIMGSQVIVEGVEDHNPLSEGSILWITETRSPLGVVDEIFGPVKNPYYMVRYNTETEVPDNIQQGSPISFVPEFADYVLNNNNLYKKGYDASGENDEELSDEVEFSDDEKEAEYKKMKKQAKRGSINDQKNGNVKKDKKARNRGGNWKNNHGPTNGSGPADGPNGGPGGFSPVPPAYFSGPSSGVWKNNHGPTASSGLADGSNGGPSGLSPVPPAQFSGPSSGVWPPPNTGFPNFMQQNMIPQPFQNIGLSNLAPFHHPQMFANNFLQQPNFGGNQPPFGSWPNNFNPQQVGPPPQQMGPPPMGFQGFSGPPMNGIQMMNNGMQMENNNNNGAMRPPTFAGGNGEMGRNSNDGQGFSNRGGRGGGGRFNRGGRGRGRGRFRGGRNGN